MKWNTIAEARAAGLIQLTEWCRHCQIEEDYLDKEYRRIISKPGRIVMGVKSGIQISLWVDDLAEKERKTIR